MADDIVVNYDTDSKQINLDNNLVETKINIKDDNDLLSGVELLTNKKKEKTCCKGGFTNRVCSKSYFSSNK